jgi:hypothetical protein
MFDPLAQMNPWLSGQYGFGQQQPFGMGFPQQYQQGQGFGFGQTPGFGQQLSPQTWFGNPFGGMQSGMQSHPLLQQAVQQIPQLVHHAQQISQQVPQLIQQLPQLIQQNPQLLQQAPQLQQIPHVLQAAAILAQQVPHVLQALSQTQTGGYGGGSPFQSGGGYRPFGYGLAAFA